MENMQVMDMRKRIVRRRRKNRSKLKKAISLISSFLKNEYVNAFLMLTVTHIVVCLVLIAF